MKILVVDDESLIREVIIEYLKLEKMEYQEASDGYQAIELVKNEDFDVVIMDIMMPKMDGYQAVKEIRKFSKVPFIMLSARSEEYDKLTCFDIGVDDYVTKPFSPRELIARIKAVTKRNQKNQVSYKFQGLEVDVEAHEVFVDGKKLNLTPKEYDLLIYLEENGGTILTREQILFHVWDADFDETRTVDLHIGRLRQKLGLEDVIKTIYKIGYLFEV